MTIRVMTEAALERCNPICIYSKVSHVAFREIILGLYGSIQKQMLWKQGIVLSTRLKI